MEPAAAGQRFGMAPVFLFPPRMSRLNYITIVQFQSASGFIFGDQHFVQLFAGTDSDVVHAATRSNRFSHVGQFHAWDLGHKNLSAVLLLDAARSEEHTSELQSLRH